jgi:hypothetical protein
VQALGRLCTAILTGEERDRRLRIHLAHGGLEDIQILLLPALDAVHDDEAATHREGHRVQRSGNRLRRGRLALKELEPLCPTLRLSQLAQPRAALRDPTVVITVDQVGGFEARRHG